MIDAGPLHKPRFRWRRQATGAVADDAPPGSIYFIGNATMLVRYNGFTFLTDPAFIGRGEQTWLGYGDVTTRLVDPAIGIDQLPPLDFVLLSRYHGDHFDLRAEHDLDKRVPVLSTPDSAADLAERGFARARGLRTWDSATLTSGARSLTITALPARHGVRPGHQAPDLMGSMIELREHQTDPPFRIYISGDTMLIDEMREIRARFPRIDLAILHLGGTRIGDQVVTMDAEEGLRVMQAIDARITMPVHYNDFDVFTSALDDFAALVDAAGLTDRIHYIHHGETYRFLVDGPTASPAPDG